MRRIRLNPIAIALILAVILFVVGGIVQPGFASYGQAMNILRLAAFLGIVAAGQTLVPYSSSGSEKGRTTRRCLRSPSRSAWDS